MREINQLLKEIIPPSDYQHRNGFGNDDIIDSLFDSQKIEVEARLIDMLKQDDDTLIGETLAYMKSNNSLTVLLKRIELTTNPHVRIIYASCINEIKGGDEEMKKLALNEFEKVTEKYALLSTFHVLSRFKDSRVEEKIHSYINDKDYLIAYNAITSIGIDVTEIIKRERQKPKKWWQFWKSKKASP